MTAWGSGALGLAVPLAFDGTDPGSFAYDIWFVLEADGFGGGIVTTSG